MSVTTPSTAALWLWAADEMKRASEAGNWQKFHFLAASLGDVLKNSKVPTKKGEI